MVAQETISEIAQQVFQTQLASMQAHLKGCIAGKDPIHLHDLRVANRRTRAAMSEFRDLFPEDEFTKFQKEFQWIHKITGEVRDLDVSLAHIPGYMKEMPKEWRTHLVPMHELLEMKRAKAQVILRKKLGSERVLEVLDGWAMFLESGDLNDGPIAKESARECGCRMIIKRYRKVRKKGLNLSKKTPAARFHAYRITIKRLRYLMEFLRPVIESEEYSRLRTGLKGVQDAFGSYQDTDVQRERLLEIANELQGSGQSAETMLALGLLIGILDRKLKKNKKNSLRQVRWLIGDSTARSFQSCFQYPVD